MSSLLSLDYSDTIPLTSIARILGLEESPDLSRHSVQIMKWDSVALPFYILARPSTAILLILLFIVTIYISTITEAKNFSPQALGVFWVIMTIFSLLVPLAYLLVPIRFLARGWTSMYQESICVRELIYLLFELQNDISSSNKDVKRNLQYRLNRLARYTRALAGNFPSPNKNNQRWAKNHFDRMSDYIQERERWLLAPTSTTWHTLQHDFKELAEIYIGGNYGMFQWDASTSSSQKTEGWLLKAFRVAGRFVIFVVPIGLMIWLLANAPVLASLNVNANFVTLLLVAWILLGVDSV